MIIVLLLVVLIVWALLVEFIGHDLFHLPGWLVLVLIIAGAIVLGAFL